MDESHPDTRPPQLEYGRESQPQGRDIATWIGRALCILIVLGIAVVFGGGYLFIRAQMAPYRKHQRILLYQTNQQTIEDSCRKLWDDWLQTRSPSQAVLGLRPENPKVPAVIRSLGPQSSIRVSMSGVSVEFGGADNHYGFAAIFSDAPDAQRWFWPESMPSRQTAPHLWYYSETGIVGP